MERENKEEILKALRTIKGVCIAHALCENCPLSKNERCVVNEQIPEEWQIKSTDTWTAFER